MNDDVVERLVRYVDDYGWGWGVVKRQINDFFGTDYTVAQLQQMYKALSAEKRAVYGGYSGGSVGNQTVVFRKLISK